MRTLTEDYLDTLSTKDLGELTDLTESEFKQVKKVLIDRYNKAQQGALRVLDDAIALLKRDGKL